MKDDELKKIVNKILSEEKDNKKIRELIDIENDINRLKDLYNIPESINNFIAFMKEIDKLSENKKYDKIDVDDSKYRIMTEYIYDILTKTKGTTITKAFGVLRTVDAMLMNKLNEFIK